ncbi:MAG: FAD-binding oxidoreductase [Candidatus Yanofskybacteria bacterium]|nr:FAD-binding oxidoreductase [Candidatus Yanofskybacteria bacterium]
MDSKQELDFLEGEALNDEEALQTYSRDASLFEVKPKLVVFPKHAQDLKKLVRFAHEHPEKGISLTARSAGTCMTGGPLSESIVLDFTKHFRHVKEVKKTSEREGYGVVEPGVYYRDFEQETLKQNLLLQSYPASREICAVGGMVANGGGGENSLRYGKTDKFVRELRCVLSDGNEYGVKPLTRRELEEKMKQDTWEGRLYQNMFELLDANYDLLSREKPKVTKNSAGYALWDVWNRETEIFDFTKLFCGSQGTLGLITEITFKLLRPHPYSTLLVIFLKDLGPLPRIVERILAHSPESFEAYDDKTLKLALRFLPGFVKLLKGNIFSLGLRFLPELKMLLLGGMPKLVLFAEFAGDSEEETRAAALTAQKSLKDLKLNMRITRAQKEVEKYFTVRRESFNLLRNHVKGRRTAPFIDDLVVDPQYLAEFFPRLQQVLKPYEKYMTYTIAGHVGDGNFHIIPLMDMSKQESRRIIPELMEKVHALVFEYGGSFTAEHNDGLIRTPFLKDMYSPEMLKLFVETKRIFDPSNIFNPGKKVNGDLAYTLSHIAKEN